VLTTIIATITTFLFIMRKDITVVVDGKEIKLVTYKPTFDLALKKANIHISIKDRIDKSLYSKIVNNDVITINHAVNLKVFVDNKELNISSAQKNVAVMLNTEKINLGPYDKIYPTIGNKLSSGMNITITRVKTETLQQKKLIDFNTVIKKDKNTLEAQSKVLQNGISGEKNIVTKVIYENGKEVARKVIKENVVKKPQSKIIAQGTLSSITVSRGQSSTTPSKTLKVKATAYSAVNAYTSSGRKAVRNSNGFSTIAVDPNIIPLGTRLYVEGYGYAIAADEGSGVKGKFIDVFFNTIEEASNWGVKYLEVKILD